MFALRVSVSCLLLALSFVASRAQAQQGQEETPYYLYDGAQVPLEIDATRLTLFRADDSAAAWGGGAYGGLSIEEAIEQAGLDDAGVTEGPMQGWHDAETELSANDTTTLAELVAIFALSSTVDFVSPVFMHGGGEVRVTRELFIRFTATTSSATARARIAALGLGEVLEEGSAGIPNLFLVKTPFTHAFAVLDAANEASLEGDVLYAEPSMITEAQAAFTPDDPRFVDQWALRNTHPDHFDIDLDADQAWDVTRGVANTIVTVIDDGIDRAHEDLRVLLGYDLFTGANGAPVGVHDVHGTNVAGIIGATINNGLGVAGIAPYVTLASARAYSRTNASLNAYTTPAMQANSVLWGRNLGSRVIVNSNNELLPSSISADAYAAARAAGVLVFISAGNGGSSTLPFPAYLGSVYAVGGIATNGLRYISSNYGVDVDFVAPGFNLWTTDRMGAPGAAGNYANVDGTSFAAPYAAGVAALILSIAPALTLAEVEGYLESTGSVPIDTDFEYAVFPNANAAVLAVTTTNPSGCGGPAWNVVATTGPGARSQHMMAYDSLRNRVMLYGGDEAATSAQLWAWDGGTRTWAQLSSSPSPGKRYGSSMVYDEARDQLILFGGYIDGFNAWTNDTWVWDGDSWSLVATSGPPPRTFHAMAYDANRGRAVLFGGYNGSMSPQFLGDTWEWDGDSWTEVATTGPSRRYTHSMAFDSARGRTVMHGGSGQGGLSHETWEWDGGHWSLRTTTGAPPSATSMTHDPIHGGVLALGGSNAGNYSDDLWRWNGSSWATITAEGPGLRVHHAIAYDALHDELVSFGGGVGGNSDHRTHAWNISTPVSVVSHTTSRTSIVGSIVTLSVNATGSAPSGLTTLQYTWKKGGVVLVDGGRIAGATTATLFIDAVQLTDAGNYTVEVTGRCNTATSASIPVTVLPPPVSVAAVMCDDC